MSEQVLVIPANVAATIAPSPFNRMPKNPATVEQIILESHSFREREEAETNFAFKQVIPYIVVVNTGSCAVTESGCSSAPFMWLLAQRTSQQQEKRLHNKYSIGQGGHINNLDSDGSRSPIVNGLLREIAEEFTLEDIRDFTPVGIINDNSTEVSRVHIGIVYMMRVGSYQFQVAEHGKHTANWATREGLERFYEKMESWSQIVYTHLIK